RPMRKILRIIDSVRVNSYAARNGQRNTEGVAGREDQEGAPARARVSQQAATADGVDGLSSERSAVFASGPSPAIHAEPVHVPALFELQVRRRPREAGVSASYGGEKIVLR